MQNMDANAAEIRTAYEMAMKKHQQVTQMLSAVNDKAAAMNEDSPLPQVEAVRKESQDLLTLLGKLENDLQKMVETLSSIEEKVKAIATNVPRAKKDYAEAKVIYDKNVLEMNDKIKPLRVQMKEMEPKIDQNLLKRYKSVKQNHAVPLVAVANKRCTGCNMELPSVTMERAKGTATLLECENCGRLLFISET
jgi:predicted  nucleic acid-binding Zn-ribbon protein